MSSEDILRNRQRQVRPRRMNSTPDILSQREQLSYYNPPKNYRSTNNYIAYNRNTNKMVTKQLSMAQKTGRLIGLTAKRLLDTSTKLVKTVAKASLALMAVVGYLNQKRTYDTQGYSNVDRFLGKEPGVPGGFAGLKTSGRSSGKLSAKGLQMIKNKEGFKEKAYKDQGGIWTIGYGHTGNVKPGDTVTKEQAEQTLRNDVSRFEKCVNKHVKVPISQNMFDALTVFCYNIGEGAFAGSTLLKKLNFFHLSEDFSCHKENFPLILNP